VALWRSGGREVALLKVRVLPQSGDRAGENAYVVLVSGLGVGLLDGPWRARLRDAMGSETSPGQGLWRGRLEGGRILGVQTDALAFAREGHRGYARAEDRGALGLEPLGDDEPRSAEGQGIEPEALAAAGRRIVEELVRAGADGRREALRRALAKAVAKLERRIDAIRGDLARMHQAGELAEQARLFVAQAAQAPRGATKLEAIDWTSGQAKAVEITLDPARGAREQIDAMFRRARRLKEGAKIAGARLADAERVRDVLSSLAGGLAACDDADLAALEASARAIAPRDFRVDATGAPAPKPRTGDDRRRPPYRTFLGISGSRILVGRSAAHNDTLTFRVARPHDLWLHAKNMTGAHVIVPLDKTGGCPADVLVDAAHLAAHFSDARDERLVEVQYAPRRYLRKPRGSPPGLVVVDREKVIVLRREDERLAGLLQREAAEG
jgi:NFACT N-terminal and middle domains/NFACT protein RNA binding domain